MQSIIGAPVLMGLLAMASVALWTLRVAVAARGLKLLGSGVAAVEAVVFALTFSQLVTDLSAPDRLAGYGVGVAIGTAVGLGVNDRLSRGQSELQLVVRGAGMELAERFQQQGWPATWIAAQGPFGPVTKLWITADDEALSVLISDVRRLAPDGFWTTRRLRTAVASPLPDHFRQIRPQRAR